MIYVLITLVYLLGCVSLYFGPAFFGYKDLDDKFRFANDWEQWYIIFGWPAALPLIVMFYIMMWMTIAISMPLVYAGIIVLEKISSYRKSIYEKYKK
jgi:hypothetical protein